jgi:hypothetical protein
MKALKAVAAVTPAPALVIVGKWLALFSATRLAHPEWQESADAIALGVGAFVAVFLCIGLADARKEMVRRWAWVGFVLTLLALAGCWGIWFYLGPPRAGERAPDPVFWRDLWQTLYIAAMVLLIATISLGALSLEQDKPGWFWTIAAVATIVLLVALVGYFWWR